MGPIVSPGFSTEIIANTINSLPGHDVEPVHWSPQFSVDGPHNIDITYSNQH